MDNAQVARIQKMESSFNRVRKAVDALESSLNDYENIQRRIKELQAYQESGQWLKDFEDDECGNLPADLLRGVLSEDGLDSLFSDIASIHARMVSLTEDPEQDDEFNPGLSLSEGFTEFDPLIYEKNSIPAEKGNYLVVLREGCSLPPSPFIPSMKEFEGYKVIYTGISQSEKGLRNRIGHDHFKGHSAFSTFRTSLGCLLGYRLIHRDRIPDGKHYRFREEDETALTDWMKRNLIVFYKPSLFCEQLEDVLIGFYNPPLNIDKNHSPVNAEFRCYVKELRDRKPAL